MELIKQGAEAKVFKVEYLGKQAIVKQRFRKTYRHPLLDEKLTHRRTLQEVRSMLRCRKSGIRTPVVYHLDNETHSIYMEDITGAVTARDFINSLLSENSKTSLRVALEDLARKIGETIARMHEADVVHGDLTTSNMLIQTNGTTESLVIIDFGLSFISTLAEDKGVDLYVLERAFLSTHPNTEDIFGIFLKSYVTSSTKKSAQAVIAKLDEVRMRGRKRVMIG